MPTFHERLAAAGPAEVITLLGRRPEVLWAPQPRTLSELATRLDDPYAVSMVLQTAPLPCLQLAQALSALGGTATRAELTDFLGATVAEDVHTHLRWLTDRAIVRSHDRLLEGSPALRQCFPDPLGLGPPLDQLLANHTIEQLRRILRELGQPLPKSKAQHLTALTDYLGNPDKVRDVTARAPAAINEWLTRRAHNDADPSGLDNRETQLVAQRATEWATARGLLISEPWGYSHPMPREVALALRGPGYRAPFTPHAPAMPAHDVAAKEVAGASAAAASAFSAQSTAILDRISRTPVPTLKSGGVGARELTRLAKATDCPEVEVRLVLELAGACGLLDENEDGITVGASYPAWRAGEPADRYGDLAEAWRNFGAVPTEARADGKSIPVLRQPGTCASCQRGRRALLQTLSTVDSGRGVELADVGPAALWTCPLAHAQIEEDAVPFATTWREAETLGIIALGALSPLGRLLLAEDGEGMVALAGTVLPGTVDQAIFGTDLTAVVAGTPSVRVTALLDSCADRESRGAAVVWRLSPASVRRALDEGVSAEQLLQELGSIARGALPQPLSYLIGDVDRRHGAVRVRPAVSCLRSDDVALLAEVAADRALKRLGLALLAPTVLTSQKSAEETVTALRGAGYFPMPEGADGTVAVKPPSRPAAASPARGTPRPASAPTVQTLVERLFASGAGEAEALSGTERVITELAPQLPENQARLLAHAIDTSGDVTIAYLSSTGGLTERRLSDLELFGDTVFAWCELRQDARHFTLRRIESVRPTGR